MSFWKKDMVRLTDDDLIEGCIQGRSASQEMLYKRFSAKMMGVCLRYAKNQEEAEDIFQEAFVKIFQNLQNFRRESSLETWMRKVMANTALKHLRKAINKIEHISIEYVEDIKDHQFEKAVDKLNRDEMLRMIETLPAGYRAVFNLYAFEGYSHKEIAEQLEITESTSKSQLARARKYLQNLILQTQEADEISYERSK